MINLYEDRKTVQARLRPTRWPQHDIHMERYAECPELLLILAELAIFRTFWMSHRPRRRPSSLPAVVRPCRPPSSVGVVVRRLVWFPWVLCRGCWILVVLSAACMGRRLL